MKMRILYNFHLGIVIIGVVGYLIGHIAFHGTNSVVLRMISRKKIHVKNLSAQSISKILIEENPHVDPYNITVIKIDLLKSNDSSVGIHPNLEARFSGSHNQTNKVWVVTPTYRRGDQLALLSRLAHAMYPARHFVKWLIIDEYEKGSDLNIKHIRKYLKTFSISYSVKRSAPRTGSEKVIFAPKGVDARNDALNFLREDPSVQDNDVVYFADDDNGYDSEIFFQMRDTKEISMWPTGVLTPKTGLSSPIVRNGQLHGFFDGWVVNRRIPVDFAMFAMSVGLLRQNPGVMFPYIAGYIETFFLQKLYLSNGLTLTEDYSIVQMLAKNCTEIQTWHTNSLYRKKVKTIKSSAFLKVLENKGLTNIDILFKTYYLPVIEMGKKSKTNS